MHLIHRTRANLRSAARDYNGAFRNHLARAAPPPVASQVAFARLATAMALVSTGALAVGALAIGVLAIRSLRLKEGRVERLRIEDLEVGRLRVRELLRGDEEAGEITGHAWS